MHLVVGLGNPGAEYAGTRHNVGFEVVDTLSRRHDVAVQKRDFQAVYGDGLIGGTRVLLARPMTFMNLSGEAVAGLCRFYKVDPRDVIIVLDEVALPLGQLRLRLKGSAGGHNGLASVLDRMHTNEVPRIRIGVGAPRAGRLIGHVLSRFPAGDFAIMREAYERAADAVEVALLEGFETAMNRFNVRPATPAMEDPRPENSEAAEPENCK